MACSTFNQVERGPQMQAIRADYFGRSAFVGEPDAANGSPG